MNNNIIKNIHKTKGYRTGQKALTDVQVEKLLSSIGNLEHLALLQIAISTGMRRSDVVKLKQSDIDSDECSISFWEEKKDRIHKVYVSRNVINIVDMLKNINKNHKYMFLGKSESVRGKGHISSKTAYNILRRYLDKAGIPRKPFHALRATCIKMCQKKGWTAEQTAELVGDTISVIQQHYLTPSIEEMKNVAQEKSII